MARKLEGKLPTGVEFHGASLRIWFMYKGRRCKETITNVVTPGNIKHCASLRDVIVAEIKQGTFNYRKHFPDSPRVLDACGNTGSNLNVTLAEKLDEHLADAKMRKARKTWQADGSRYQHLLDYFTESCRVRDISKRDADKFIAHLLAGGVSPKTVSNITPILRWVLRTAFEDGVLAENVADRITDPGANETDNPARRRKNPFTLKELSLLERLRPSDPDVDFFLFNCWTGLSVSEAMALGWNDLENAGKTGKLRIRRALVDLEYRVPKETHRNRTIELNQKAADLLKAQMERTRLLPPIDVQVTQRNNVQRMWEPVQFIWRVNRSGGPWGKTSIQRAIKRLCLKAGVDPRSANQCRHTFASQMLTMRVPQEVIARQMGHRDTEMLKKHYGEWIEADETGNASEMNRAIAARLGQNS